MTPEGFVEVDGLAMAYEWHEGFGEENRPPLLLLHGAFGTAEYWTPRLPLLLPTRSVLILEQQGHGRTPDRDGPLEYGRMADDTAAALEALGMGPVDVFGYSDGGVVAIDLAIHHPERVRRIAAFGASTRPLSEAYSEEDYREFLTLSPESFDPPELLEPYRRRAPNPAAWGTLVEKIARLGREFRGFSDDELARITAPTLLLQGDRDVNRPEHAVEMWRAIPGASLAIFPGADHFLPHTDPKLVLGVILPFFDAE